MKEDVTIQQQTEDHPSCNRANRLMQTYIICRHKLGLLYMCTVVGAGAIQSIRNEDKENWQQNTVD